MWSGPKKGDKIGDRIRGEAELDRARFSGGARAIYGPYSNGSGHKTLRVLIITWKSKASLKYAFFIKLGKFLETCNQTVLFRV